MLSKGLPKVETLFSGNIKFPAVLGMISQFSLSLTVFAQVICSVLIMAGSATRFAAPIVLAINMLVAAVVVAHNKDPFEKAEPALRFLMIYVILLLTGAGKYSLDNLIAQKLIGSKTVTTILFHLV